MTQSKWYTITPTGPIALGNLTPVGQNSGMVGCRWPPNGHQLAACLELPNPNAEGKGGAQLQGPFWYNGQDPYVALPLPVYTTEENFAKRLGQETIPIHCMEWQDRWTVQARHQNLPSKSIEIIGGQCLIGGNSLQRLWQHRELKADRASLKHFPWKTLTLSHNTRQNYQVVDEGGFFAEQTTLIDPGWSILVRILQDDNSNYAPPQASYLGAGATPVVISELSRMKSEWLDRECSEPQGAVLLTGAIWNSSDRPQPYRHESFPYPPVSLKGYAAEQGQPWQSWKKIRDRQNPNNKVKVLTPGQWLTPAGAVYLWDGDPPIQQSQPFPNQHFHLEALGYGHLWLF